MAIPLPKRPPRLVEVAAAIAVVAAITIFLAWQQKRDERPTATTAAAPVITQTLPGGIVATQPLISFRVYVGCGETPDQVLIAGLSQQMPISLFDHQPLALQVVAEGVTADFSVMADGANKLQVLTGEAEVFNTALYVTVGERKLCPPTEPQH